MAYTLDDGLDEYVQQDNNPTASVPQAAPQRKSAEQAEKREQAVRRVVNKFIGTITSID